MTVSLSDLIAAASADSILGTVLDIATDLELAVTAWQEGQPTLTTLSIFAQQFADTELINLEAIKSGFLDTAEGAWLTLLAQCLYRVPRLPAVAASTLTFQVTNNGDANVDALAGELIVAHAVTGKTYRNRDDLTAGDTLAPGVNSDIVMVADEVGTDSDAAPDAITVLVSSQSDLVVTNLDACLGSDAETDPELRARCRDKLAALSPNGAKGAYAFIAKTPTYSATSVPITRVNVVASILTGVVTAYLANANGAPSDADVTVVDEAIDKWATPWGTTAAAAAATEVSIPITYQVWVSGSTLTAAQIQAKIATALAVYLKSVPIGGDAISPDPNGKVRVGILEIVIARAIPETVKVTVSLPAADEELDGNEVAKLGTITPTVTVLS